MSAVREVLAARARTVAAVLVGLLVLMAGWTLLSGGSGSKHATAYIPRAVHLYAGSNVEVLGVKVGKVDKITPMGTKVRVDFSYSAKQRIPADAAAIVLAPTVVADRVVQLAPAYTGGPVMPDHAVIPENRTAVPVELDEVFQNLNDLSVALGPKGANKTGALSRLVNVGANNLRGQGTQMHDTIVGIADLVRTLGDNKNALFDTINNLQLFTTELATHDKATRGFTTDLAQIASLLAGERQSLADALHNLSGALTDVTTFIRSNRAALADNLSALGRVTNVLQANKDLLTRLVDIAPLGASNYPHVYSPEARGFGGNLNANDKFNNPVLFACSLFGNVGGDPNQCLNLLAPLKGITIPTGPPSGGSGGTGGSGGGSGGGLGGLLGLGK